MKSATKNVLTLNQIIVEMITTENYDPPSALAREWMDKAYDRPPALAAPLVDNRKLQKAELWADNPGRDSLSITSFKDKWERHDAMLHSKNKKLAEGPANTQIDSPFYYATGFKNVTFFDNNKDRKPCGPEIELKIVKVLRDDAADFKLDARQNVSNAAWEILKPQRIFSWQAFPVPDPTEIYKPKQKRRKRNDRTIGVYSNSFLHENQTVSSLLDIFYSSCYDRCQSRARTKLLQNKRKDGLTNEEKQKWFPLLKQSKRQKNRPDLLAEMKLAVEEILRAHAMPDPKKGSMYGAGLQHHVVYVGGSDKVDLMRAGVRRFKKGKGCWDWTVPTALLKTEIKYRRERSSYEHAARERILTAMPQFDPYDTLGDPSADKE
jgi:hypothetical protein